MARVYVDDVHKKLSDAASFISRSAWVLRWGDLSGATVMDIGCGSGVSSRALVTNYPAIWRVIALEKSLDKLAVATVRNADPKIGYFLADIERRYTLSAWLGQIEKAVSVYYMNCLQDLRKGYENIFAMLKPGGEAAILQGISSPYMSFIEELKVRPRWLNIAPTLSLTGTYVSEVNPVAYFRTLFLEVGYEVIQCYKTEEILTFSSEDECKDAVFRTLTLIMNLPDHGRDELKEDAYQVFIKYNPLDDQGHRTMTHRSMVSVLRKPNLLTG